MKNETAVKLSRLAVGLAVLGSLVALANEWLHYRASGSVDWGHVALAIGVPVLMWAITRSATSKRA